MQERRIITPIDISIFFVGEFYAGKIISCHLGNAHPRFAAILCPISVVVTGDKAVFVIDEPNPGPGGICSHVDELPGATTVSRFIEDCSASEGEPIVFVEEPGLPECIAIGADMAYIPTVATVRCIGKMSIGSRNKASFIVEEKGCDVLVRKLKRKIELKPGGAIVF